MKDMAADYYKDTFEQIKRTLIAGKLVHADETPAAIKGGGSYVWAFTSMEEVIYIWSSSRDSGTAQDFLRNFEGVLVSDFYAAYDTIECAQQKCLVHLLRDLNESVLKEPFNDKLRRLACAFGDLLHPIISTIDRFGLKKHFLKKHSSAVGQFYASAVNGEFETAAAKKLQSRFRRNKHKLFTFLDYDNVPWNNNNAEHAIKAFARLRDIIDCHSSETGIVSYLVSPEYFRNL